MEVSGIIGLLVALGAGAGSLLLTFGEPPGLPNYPSILLIVGGTTGATLMSYSFRQIGYLWRALTSALSKGERDLQGDITTMVRFVRLARKHGMLALEAESRRLDNRLMRLGLQMVIDGVPAETIREVMETEVVAAQERARVGERILASMGSFSPSFGIVGTLGCVIMALQSGVDPAKMGIPVAGALLATVYGIALANLVFIPAGAKIRAMSLDEAMESDMLIEGILALQSGDGPRLVETRMMAFLSPEARRPSVVEADVRVG